MPEKNTRIMRSLILLLVLVSAAVPRTVLADTAEGGFSDVPADKYYSAPVAWAVAEEITKGTSPGHFSPNDPCIRAQVVTFLWRAAGQEIPESEDCPFTDVSTGAYYDKAVLWAKENGITAGTDETHFSPGAYCTRAQIVTFLWRFGGSAEPRGVSSFSDVKQDIYYEKAVSWAAEIGVTQGVSQMQFAPQQICTRAQVVTFLHRMMMYVPEEGILHDDEDVSHIVTKEIPAEAGQETAELDLIDNELIVKGSDPDAVRSAVEAAGGRIVGYILPAGYFQVRFAGAVNVRSLTGMKSELEADKSIEEVWYNTVSEVVPHMGNENPDDPWGDESPEALWNEYIPAGTNWGYEAINALTARRLLIEKKGGLDKVPYANVCEMDRMFEPGGNGHPDLQFDEILYFDKKSNGDNARQMAAQAGDDESYGQAVHGTMVAGIIAARADNGIGITGISVHTNLYGFALDHNGELERATGKVTISAFGKITNLAQVMESYGRDGETLVINYSAGSSGEVAYKDKEKTIRDEEKTRKNAEKARVTNENEARLAAGVLQSYLDRGRDFVIVSSAGNGRADGAEDCAEFDNEFTAVKKDEFRDIYDRIIVVGGAYINPVHPGFSYWQGFSWGDRIDVAAPGADIYSTAFPNEKLGKGYYNRQVGTSFAAPHVSGVAALVLSAAPHLHGNEVKQIICDTANIRLHNTDASGVFHNMVNAAYAVTRALVLPSYVVSGPACAATEGTGADAVFTLTTGGILTLSGSGAISEEGEKYNWRRWADSIKTVSFEEGVTEIGYRVFREAIDLENVKLPESLSVIGEEAFSHLGKLQEITLPSSLREIRASAFYNCPAMKSVTVPASVTSIGEMALGWEQAGETADGAVTLDGFTIYGYAGSEAERYANLPENAGMVFISIDKPEPTPTPEPTPSPEPVDKGKVIDSGLCYGKNVSWSLTEGGYLELAGEGEMQIYNQNAPWRKYAGQIRHVEVGDGVTAIGAGAFASCTALENVYLPEGITSIGKRAFDGCTALREIDLPDELLEIGESAFGNCSSLTELVLPEKLESIGDMAMFYCTGLTEMVIPSGVKTFGSIVFSGCKSLERVSF